MQTEAAKTEAAKIACAGCDRHFEADALAEGICAHCWAAARRIRVHGQASRQAQGDAARFVVENHLPHSLAYLLQQMLEDAAEHALHKMIYTCARESDRPPLFYKQGRTYHPIAPLDYYPAPGVWLVEWSEHGTSTGYLSRFPLPDPLRLAAAYQWEDVALAAIRKKQETSAMTLSKVVRLVLDMVGGFDREWERRQITGDP